MCSKWAEALRSSVMTVQPSSRMRTEGTPALTIGSKEGNRGKICNVVFYQGGVDPTKTFTENPIAITGDKVTALYNNFASKNPPIVSHVFNIAPTEPSYAQMRINQLIY